MDARVPFLIAACVQQVMPQPRQFDIVSLQPILIVHGCLKDQRLKLLINLVHFLQGFDNSRSLLLPLVLEVLRPCQ